MQHRIDVFLPKEGAYIPLEAHAEFVLRDTTEERDVISNSQHIPVAVHSADVNLKTGEEIRLRIIGQRLAPRGDAELVHSIPRIDRLALVIDGIETCRWGPLIHNESEAPVLRAGRLSLRNGLPDEIGCR